MSSRSSEAPRSCFILSTYSSGLGRLSQSLTVNLRRSAGPCGSAGVLQRLSASQYGAYFLSLHTEQHAGQARRIGLSRSQHTNPHPRTTPTPYSWSQVCCCCSIKISLYTLWIPLAPAVQSRGIIWMRRLEDHGLPVDMGFEGAAGRAGDDDRWIFFTERQRLLLCSCGSASV